MFITCHIGRLVAIIPCSKVTNKNKDGLIDTFLAFISTQYRVQYSIVSLTMSVVESVERMVSRQNTIEDSGSEHVYLISVNSFKRC